MEEVEEEDWKWLGLDDEEGQNDKEGRKDRAKRERKRAERGR